MVEQSVARRRGWPVTFSPVTTGVVIGGAGNLGWQVALMLAPRRHSACVFDLPGLDYSSVEQLWERAYRLLVRMQLRGGLP